MLTKKMLSDEGNLLNALLDCIDQMEQCESMFRDDREFMAALRKARAAADLYTSETPA